jgi:hypothetical protein
MFPVTFHRKQLKRMTRQCLRRDCSGKIEGLSAVIQSTPSILRMASICTLEALQTAGSVPRSHILALARGQRACTANRASIRDVTSARSPHRGHCLALIFGQFHYQLLGLQVIHCGSGRDVFSLTLRAYEAGVL